MTTSPRRIADLPVDFIEARKASRRMQVANHPVAPTMDSPARPIPVETRGGLRKYDHFYPFEEMAVGDSFWVPSDTGCTPGAVTKFAKKSGWRFVTSAQTFDGISNTTAPRKMRGTRVWRIG